MAKSQPSQQPTQGWLSKAPVFLLGLCFIGLAFVPVDDQYLQDQAAKEALISIHQQWHKVLAPWTTLASTYPWQDPPAHIRKTFADTSPQRRKLLVALLAPHPRVQLHCQPRPCSQRVRRELKRQGLLFPTEKTASLTLVLALSPQRDHWLGFSYLRAISVDARLYLGPDKTQAYLRASRSARKIHWTSLLPPLIAIFLALLTHRILLSLGLSLLLGAILYQKSLWLGTFHTFHTYIWQKAIYKEFSINIILFILALLGMINVCTRSGGVLGLIEKILPFAKTPRSSRLITALMGLLIFFDDYANTVVVGNTMRPLTDRFRVSREKLAYIIDSTAAPIAGLAILSTWIGYEVGLLSTIATELGLKMSGYQIFLGTVPFRFYCWMTLLFVFVGILSNRDFGPMLRAERRASERGLLVREGAQPMFDVDTDALTPPEGIVPRAINVVLPVLTVLASVCIGLLWIGGAFAGNSIYNALQQASNNSSRIFLFSAMLGSLVAIALAVQQHSISLVGALKTWWTGTRGMSLAVGILLLAWALSGLSHDLGTAHYLLAMLNGTLPAPLLPLLVFGMAAIVAFATGTSWGTMGILLPTVGPLAFTMGGMPIFLLSVGAVLDGAIFGDHCSPLSDTTLFSSAAAACDHIDHVKTQAPYALSVMTVASTCGYLAVAYGAPVWFAAIAALLFFVGLFSIVGEKSQLAHQESCP